MVIGRNNNGIHIKNPVRLLQPLHSLTILCDSTNTIYSVMNNFKKSINYLTLIVVLLYASSCVNTQKATYFNTQGDEHIASNVQIPQTTIEANDILGISVSSLNAEASAMFNAPNFSYANVSTANGATIQASGYLVDVNGNIQFPILGNIKAAGLTANQLRLKITDSIASRKLLVDPIVSIRYLNFKVTVLGEVQHPTVVNVLNEKITLLEALGLAGDITIYGKKDHVMVIREEAGIKNVKYLNLNSSEIFTSPYYYLKSNDIVYVEPTKARVSSSSRGTQLLPIIISGLSFAAIIIDRIITK